MEEIFENLTRCPLFAGLDRSALESVLPALHPIRRAWNKGETVLRPGAPPPGVGVVLTGGVRVVREDFWGSRSLLAVLGPGSLFAETFACAGAPLDVRVEAVAAAQAVFFPASALLSPPPGGEALPGRLLAVLAEKNLSFNRTVRYLSQRTTRAKVLSYLSDQAEKARSAVFSIPLNRQELADYLAVDRSALSAELGKLRQAGVLDFTRNRFTLLQRPES